MLVPENFFLLRTPLLPATNTSPEPALFSEALFVASPDLYASLQQPSKTEKDQQKQTLSLAKYRKRASYRCTPFGLFAGITPGTWDTHTDLRLSPLTQKQRYTRLDMDYLCALALELARKPAIRHVLRYYPNSSLYPIGDKLRYLEYRVHTKRRTHHLTTIDYSDYVQTILEMSTAGATVATLAACLVSEEVSLKEAEAFMEEMIDSQVLVSELEVVITGKEYLHVLIERLDAYAPAQEAAACLRQVEHQLRCLDAAAPTAQVEAYQEIATTLRYFDTPFELNQLFQVDMYKPAQQATLSATVAQECNKAISCLQRISPHTTHSTLERFKKLFQERYEEQEVPLTEVLDTEMGIGYPPEQFQAADTAPLLQDLVFQGQQPGAESYTWSRWQQYLVERYLNALQKGETEIQFRPEDIEKRTTQTPKHPLPDSMYVLGSLLAASGEAVDQGQYQFYLKGVGGPSAANLIGRFCHLAPSLTTDVRQMLATEEARQPDVIFAEVTHVNQARVGNISARPVLRDYEIPILVQSGVDEAHTILLSDLRVSVQHNRIVLRSERLGKEVQPRLSSAHNYSTNTVPFYHFLCDLQFQDVHAYLRWDWGALSRMPYLPRVSMGKTIVSKARWRFSAEDLAPVHEAGKNSRGIELLQEVLQHTHLPARVTVSEGDNELPLNRDEDVSWQLLISLLTPGQGLILEEDLFAAHNLLVHSPEGHFTNELLIPLRNMAVRTPTPPFIRPAEANEVQRTFVPGSEWLYVKIYCGTKTADQILTQVILPLAEQFEEEALIEKWFFIRYADPGHHLRVRFKGSRVTELLPVLQHELKPYLQANLVHSIQVDTYQRELERYGASTMDASETLFWYDSQAVARIISLLDPEGGESVRWQLAARGVDQLLTDFGYTLTDKKNLLLRLKTAFAEEFGFTGKHGIRQLSDKLRKEKETLHYILTLPSTTTDELAPALHVLETCSVSRQEVIESIYDRQASEGLAVEMNSLVASYIHMFLNRMFRSRQRMHEMVLYDLLFHYYRSVAARAEKNAVVEKPVPYPLEMAM